MSLPRPLGGDSTARIGAVDTAGSTGPSAGPTRSFFPFSGLCIDTMLLLDSVPGEDRGVRRRPMGKCWNPLTPQHNWLVMGAPGGHHARRGIRAFS